MPDPVPTTPTIEPPVGDPPPVGDTPPAGEDWRASLSEEQRNHPTIKNLDGVPAMAKMLINAESMIGADKVAVPGKDASEEVRSEFFNKLGRPEKADGYELPTENLPEGVQVNEDTVKSYFENAHKMGLSSQQVGGMYRWMLNHLAETDKAAQVTLTQQATTDAETIKAEFGDAYDERVALAQRAVEEFGDDELKKYLNETGLGNNPAMIRAWAKIGKAVASDEVLGGGGSMVFGMTPVEAQSKINEKQQDPKFMEVYVGEHLPGHKEAVQEMSKLYAAAHPEKG